MEDPVKELPEVVRKITEPYAATEIAHNFENRVLTINNQIEFHAVMFSEDKLKAAVELTETLQGRFIPIWVRLRFISRVDLRQEGDGKYRICRQEDNYPNDLHRAGLDLIPGLASVLAIWKLAIALTSALVGNFYLKHGLFGP
ncbi:hypothetical protein PtA15_6A55 [Puccinia triticina]|uniref:SigF-like NTF2-like domain-containing protein n=1 Tax=Puccinia triticina TaxID=208348 RepID=A0ABY7CN70_9BASI|nr:uncharacterized protein PtA15_6A55 [Puccinia triticina]WAQ85427.1 hypothetical protein PtA15_6A55 [Puccinia triticina]